MFTSCLLPFPKQGKKLRPAWLAGRNLGLLII